MIVASELTKDLFQQNVGTVFEMTVSDEKKVALELFEVNELRSDPRAEAFSLMFRADPAEVYAGSTYRVQHAAIGEFDLFLTPVARDAQGTIYEAVFNRMRRDASK